MGEQTIKKPLICCKHVSCLFTLHLSSSREWYSYHFPELVKLVPDNFTYAKTVYFIGNRKELSAEKLEGLEEVVMDSAKAQAILEAARVSMGGYCRT